MSATAVPAAPVPATVNVAVSCTKFAFAPACSWICSACRFAPSQFQLEIGISSRRRSRSVIVVGRYGARSPSVMWSSLLVRKAIRSPSVRLPSAPRMSSSVAVGLIAPAASASPSVAPAGHVPPVNFVQSTTPTGTVATGMLLIAAT
jgi:hypothetical protein